MGSHAADVTALDVLKNYLFQGRNWEILKVGRFWLKGEGMEGRGTLKNFGNITLKGHFQVIKVPNIYIM